jgi:recombinational DNA repair protein RecT
MSVLEQKVKQICNHPDHLVFFTESAINTVTRKVLHRGMAVMNAILSILARHLDLSKNGGYPYIYTYIYIYIMYMILYNYIYYVII